MEIEINSIAGQVIVGCYDYERIHTQRIMIDLSAKFYAYNWLSQDELDTTVDYDEIVDFVQNLLPQTDFQLLESLAQYLAQQILDHFSIIQTIKITLVKPAICDVKAHEIKVNFTQSRKFKVALALGSNWSKLPQQQLITAIEILGEYVSEVAIGGFYETSPVGFTQQDNFYNTAIIGYTHLRPEELLGKIKSIEKLMGKEEILVNGPRIIDIDLLLFDNLVYTHNFLTVPHKAMHMRDFVLQPLNDIAPDWVHPIINLPISALCANVPMEQRSVMRQVDYYK